MSNINGIIEIPSEAMYNYGENHHNEYRDAFEQMYECIAERNTSMTERLVDNYEEGDMWLTLPDRKDHTVFKPGDVVRIRSWNQMMNIGEYNDDTKAIHIQGTRSTPGFPSVEKRLCGNEFTISNMVPQRGYHKYYVKETPQYYFLDWMLELVL